MTVVVANNSRPPRLRSPGKRKSSSTLNLLPAELSTPNSPSTSPMNLSRSTSPAASIANFIRPISPPCIQVKEPLSPKFARASSTTVTFHNHLDEPNACAVLESCFEPETYRHSKQQKKLSCSDPTLNQTTKLRRPELLRSEDEDEIRSIDDVEEQRPNPPLRRSRQVCRRFFLFRRKTFCSFLSVTPVRDTG